MLDVFRHLWQEFFAFKPSKQLQLSWAQLTASEQQQLLAKYGAAGRGELAIAAAKAIAAVSMEQRDFWLGQLHLREQYVVAAAQSIQNVLRKTAASMLASAAYPQFVLHGAAMPVQALVQPLPLRRWLYSTGSVAAACCISMVVRYWLGMTDAALACVISEAAIASWRAAQLGALAALPLTLVRLAHCLDGGLSFLRDIQDTEVRGRQR